MRSEKLEQVIQGYIHGGDFAANRGSGFRAVRNNTGDYTIVFDKPFANVPIIMVALASATGNLVMITDWNNTSQRTARFVAMNNAGALVESRFTFVAIGRPVG